MDTYDWLLFLHVLGAFLVLGGAVLAGVFNFAALRRERPSEIAMLFKFARVGVVSIGIGMVLTIVFGLWLWLGWFKPATGWLHAKIALVAVLVGYHLWCWRLLRDFAAERNRKSHVWFRWFNEFPVLVLIATVLLVVFKPF